MKAKPTLRRLRDDFFTAVDTNSGHLGQIAEFPQLLDPAWCVALHREGFVIDRGILVGHLRDSSTNTVLSVRFPFEWPWRALGWRAASPSK
jgi:hypothetical protein